MAKKTDDTTEEIEPIARGRFSLYVTPDGGYHIAALIDGEDNERHAEIPGAALKMAGMLGGKNPMTLLNRMFGGS
jgi:hypothetical protein